MKKVLITGASGFVGQNLAAYLKASGDYEVSAVTRNTGKIKNHPGINQVLTYEELQNSTDKYDAIVHLAGLAHDTSAKLYAEEDYKKANFELTKDIFERFSNQAAGTFIFVSTSKVYDENVEEVNEDSPLKDSNSYSLFKLYAEKHIQERMGSAMENQSYYILRPSIIHGPNNKGNLNMLFSLVSKGIPYPLSAFDNKRSFLHVDNLSFLIHRLIHQRPSSGIYNVADDGYISTRHLVNLMGEEMKKKVIQLKIPPHLMKFVFKMGDVFKLPVNSQSLHKLVGTRIIDNSKIKKALNISTLPIGIQHGLRRTIQSLLVNRK
jgi:nucleoside-diphosphate-sugar epimerase